MNCICKEGKGGHEREGRGEGNVKSHLFDEVMEKIGQ